MRMICNIKKNIKGTGKLSPDVTCILKITIFSSPQILNRTLQVKCGNTHTEYNRPDWLANYV